MRQGHDELVRELQRRVAAGDLSAARPLADLVSATEGEDPLKAAVESAATNEGHVATRARLLHFVYELGGPATPPSWIDEVQSWAVAIFEHMKEQVEEGGEPTALANLISDGADAILDVLHGEYGKFVLETLGAPDGALSLDPDDSKTVLNEAVRRILRGTVPFRRAISDIEDEFLRILDSRDEADRKIVAELLADDVVRVYGTQIARLRGQRLALPLPRFGMPTTLLGEQAALAVEDARRDLGRRTSRDTVLYSLRSALGKVASDEVWSFRVRLEIARALELPFVEAGLAAPRPEEITPLPIR